MIINYNSGYKCEYKGLTRQSSIDDVLKKRLIKTMKRQSVF